MTQGRCGSLLHIRMTLSFTTPRRFSRRTRRNAMLTLAIGTSLKWNVFVAQRQGLTRDLPPGKEQWMWVPTSATLISGQKDAVLVDALLTVEQVSALVEWVVASGKNLTTICVTHGHGDHFFGLTALLDRFPNAKAVATPGVVKVMRRQASPESVANFWNARYPGQIPELLVIAEELKGNVIDLEGCDLVAVEVGHTDTDHTTCLHVPSVGLVVAGDAAYNDVHLYLAESNTQTRREWISAMPAAKPEASPAMRITPTLPWRYSTATTWNSARRKSDLPVGKSSSQSFLQGARSS